jgi:hypothetical protein
VGVVYPSSILTRTVDSVWKTSNSERSLDFVEMTESEKTVGEISVPLSPSGNILPSIC